MHGVRGAWQVYKKLGAMSGKISGHNRPEIVDFSSPAGYML